MKLLRSALLAVVCVSVVAQRPDFLPANDRLRAVFYLNTLPKPPKETRALLTPMIAGELNNADLLALRAREAERQLDFVAAEADWKEYVRSTRGKGQVALADFYHRRNRGADEVQALSGTQEYDRIFQVIEAQALPPALAITHYRAWVARQPQAAEIKQRFFRYLLAQKQFAEAEQLLTAYKHDEVFPVQGRASLALARGSAGGAAAVYDRAFQPLWPAELATGYFQVLTQARDLRGFLARARQAVAARPDDLEPAARLVFYYQQSGNLAAARRALLEYRLRRESRPTVWKPDELRQLARLFESLQDYNEAARAYYALYSLPGVDAASAETALAGICNVLLTAPEQGIAFGAGDLSFFKDIGTADPYPGFLNGILSLLLNSTSPESQYRMQQSASVAYFHRARAAELLALFDTRFANSTRRPTLRAKLIEAYAASGANDGVIAEGRRFWTAYPKAAERTRVGLLVAEAHARKNEVNEEFATYDLLLRELAAVAGGVPLGERAGTPPQQQPEDLTDKVNRFRSVPDQAEPDALAQAQAIPDRPVLPAFIQPGSAPEGRSLARSPEYARVLDRYLARLASMKRLNDALALYRREIDRNPNDPGLYERLAIFLDQNRRAAEVEQVYRRAMQQFQDRTWHHKLARWYLRQKRQADFGALTSQVIGIFAGSDLDKYFREVVATSAIDPQLYRQVNLAAHDRFPHNLTFVKNLANAYQRRETFDAAALERLLRDYWFLDSALRSRFFELLSRSNRLAAELQTLKAAPPSTANRLFIGEAEAWQCHFEAAAPPLKAVTVDYPADGELVRRVAAIHRSLGDTDASAALEQNLANFDPRDRTTLARVGEVYADKEQFDRARPWWNRIAQVDPGKSDGYLEAATVFWDYYLFDDALRLINEGRSKLQNPNLFRYETGAVYENRRDYSRAVDEYVRGALAGSDSARNRLLTLGRRPAHRALVETATSREVSSLAGFGLRATVLEQQNRRDDLEKFLGATVAATSNFELLERTGGIADRLGMDAIRQQALERQITLVGDPVEATRLRLALVRFHEGKGNVDEARRVAEALYRDQPKTLGVVRAVVDFYWRNKLTQPAVDLLGRAAADSHATLRKQFAFEAVRKSLEAGQSQQARTLIAPLLKEDPFNASYLGTMAETYAQAKDDRGLRDFYNSTIQAMRDAPLTADERTARIAGLRRGLIPALVRLQDFTGAVDQYIEVINRYPEEEGTIREAALAASRWRLNQRLIDYYNKTAVASPRDHRWPMVLARLHTALESFPEAITAYGRASELRPERTDLLAARATLEERLLRFDDALRDYTRLYDLTYRNPEWMEKAAEVQARRGNAAEAVAALRKALIEGRPERPTIFFNAAARLESWNMLEQARTFSEKGIELAGDMLLQDGEYQPGAESYARIMTRLRQYEAAISRLQGLEGSPQGVLRQIGATAAQYFTPQERTALADYLEKQNQPQRLLIVADNAGLADLEARWLVRLMMQAPGQPQSAGYLRRLEQLQQRRMKHDELGNQIEAYWRAFPPGPNKAQLLDQAAEAYRDAGNVEAEMRVLSQRPASPRLVELLLKHAPERLVTIASTSQLEGSRNLAASTAVASGNADLARRAIAGRGTGLPPVWTRAYTALAGLYTGDTTPAPDAAFRELLGSPVLGERIGKPVDRAQQLAGNTWFYYGSRYGEFLDVRAQPQAEDYLVSLLEGHPARASGYFTLGEYAMEKNKPAQAQADYEHALELQPVYPVAHDRIAGILWQQNKRDEAAARWRAALTDFQKVQDQGRVPEEFWTEVPMVLGRIGQNRLLPVLRDDADRLLRTYIRRNGAYRVEPLLRGAVNAGGDPAAGLQWILDLARVAGDPADFLAPVARASWLSTRERETVLRRLVTLARERVTQSRGEALVLAKSTLEQAQIELFSHLLRTRNGSRADPALTELTDPPAVLVIRDAARSGSLARLLEQYRSEPEKSPEVEALTAAARELRADNQIPEARTLLEFAYGRELDRQNLTAPNFLGLAELRLETGDVPGALALLRRMVLVAGAPFEHLTAAASLLEKSGKHGEAIEFLNTRVRSTPWDSEAWLALARVQIAANRDRDAANRTAGELAASAAATYATRDEAAGLLGRSQSPLHAVQRTTDAAERIRLALAALAAGDKDDRLRPLLFRALMDRGQHAQAVAALEPMLERHGFSNLWSRYESDEERGEEEGGYSQAAQFLVGSENRPELARGLARALEQLDRLGAAEAMLKIAQELEPSDAVKRDLDRISAERLRRKNDALRQPEITVNLEQPRTVRPTLRGSR